MSEKQAIYTTGNPESVTLTQIRSWKCCRPYTDPEYVEPTAQQVRLLLEFTGWSQTDAAKIIGVSYSTKNGSEVIRRYKSENPGRHRQIAYAPWRLLLIHAGIVAADIDTRVAERHPELRKAS